MKKIRFPLIIAIVAIITSCTRSVPIDWNLNTLEPVPQPFDGELNSRAAFVLNLSDGTAEYALNETERMIPASTTKIMTALLTLEYCGDSRLDQPVEVPEWIFDGFDTDDPNTEGGSIARLEPLQENLTYRDCLYALILPSGNDAACVLAYNIGGEISGDSDTSGRGNMEVFAAAMTAKAAELGCVNTHFANPHGLYDEWNFTCAHDLAIIAKYAYETFPLFRQICMTSEYVMPGNEFESNGYKVGNSNALIRNRAGNIYYRSYAKGIKTGALNYYYTPDNSGEWVKHDGITSLVSLGELGGNSYIIATLEAPYIYGELNEGESRLHGSYSDHLALYDWLAEFAELNKEN